jgi:2-keto-4-pentenoate hydratase
MLMSTQATRYAHALLKAKANGSTHARLSQDGELTWDDAYEVARCILNSRIASGETPVGRRIGFTSAHAMASDVTSESNAEAAAAPAIYWSTLFDSTVDYALDNVGLHTLKRSQEPRIETQLIFKLGRTPAADATLDELADCLEWMAHGMEVVDSPFKDWAFEATDAVAAFGLHRKLIIGEPRMLSRQGRHNLAQVLSYASLSLSKNIAGTSGIAGAGRGSNALGSPLHALMHLHQQLQTQPGFTPLQAGEIIATGSWIKAQPVRRGEVWSSAFAQINLEGMHLSLS